MAPNVAAPATVNITNIITDGASGTADQIATVLDDALSDVGT